MISISPPSIRHIPLTREDVARIVRYLLKRGYTLEEISKETDQPVSFYKELLAQVAE